MIPRPTRVTRTSILLPYTPLFRARLRLLYAAPVQPASEVAHARTVQVAIFFITLLLKSSASLDVEAGRGVVAGGPRTIGVADFGIEPRLRSEEHTSELQSLMRNSYAAFCLKKKTLMIQQTPL